MSLTPDIGSQQRERTTITSSPRSNVLRLGPQDGADFRVRQVRSGRTGPLTGMPTGRSFKPDGVSIMTTSCSMAWVCRARSTSTPTSRSSPARRRANLFTATLPGPERRWWFAESEPGLRWSQPISAIATARCVASHQQHGPNASPASNEVLRSMNWLVSRPLPPGTSLRDPYRVMTCQVGGPADVRRPPGCYTCAVLCSRSRPTSRH